MLTRVIPIVEGCIYVKRTRKFISLRITDRLIYSISIFPLLPGEPMLNIGQMYQFQFTVLWKWREGPEGKTSGGSPLWTPGAFLDSRMSFVRWLENIGH